MLSLLFTCNALLKAAPTPPLPPTPPVKISSCTDIPPDADFSSSLGVIGAVGQGSYLGVRGSGLGGGGTADGIGGLIGNGSSLSSQGSGLQGIGSSGYGSGGGSFGSEPVDAPLMPRASGGWGDILYLSNDDSLSLASAQRLLWAVQNDQYFSTKQIRPYEFLNYFHFDTQPPAINRLFGVQAAATRQDQTLSVGISIQAALPTRMPLDLTLVVDRSGSMGAQNKMGYVKKGLYLLEKQLQVGDRVDLVLFDDLLCTSVENFLVGRDDRAQLTAAIDALEPRGGTNLDIGLKEGYRIATGRTEKNRNRRMMLLTDAMLNEGDVNVDRVTQIGKAYEESGVRLTGVGVGVDFRDEVLDKLTEKSQGVYVFLGSEAVVDRLFTTDFETLTRTVAHDVQFALDLPESLRMKRFYGEEMSTVATEVQPVHFQAGSAQFFLQDLETGEISENTPLTLTISYDPTEGGARREERFEFTVGQLLLGQVENVRKAQALMKWTDMAVARAMSEEACVEAFPAWEAARVPDAELDWLASITAPLCAVEGSWRKPSPPSASDLSMREANIGTIKVGALGIEGELSEAEVLSVTKRYQGQLRYCYQRELAKNPGLSGRVGIQFVVGVDGHVASVKTLANTTGSTTVAQCLEGRFFRMYFPPPAKGIATVTIPLVLVP